MLTLSESQLREIIDGARHDVATRLFTERRDDLQLLSPAQVCGLLDINQKTLDTLPDGPPRVTLIVGKVIRYRACDVAAYVERRKGAAR